MKKKFIILNILLSVSVFCQINPKVNYPTPSSVWEFSKYGNMTSNEYRGLVNVEVPIYTISIDNVSIPLTAQYYTGGIRVSEEPGMIGLGWSLNLPTINQKIKGLNDYGVSTRFHKLPPFQGSPVMPNPGIFPFPGLQGMPSGYHGGDINSFVEISPEIGDIPYYTNVCNNIIRDWNGYYNLTSKYGCLLGDGCPATVDTEPDVFSVSINGDYVQFCRVNSDLTPANYTNQILPFQVINGRKEYKIDQILNPNPSTNFYGINLSGIIITDPNGNKYHFELIERINSFGGDTDINYKLTSITTSNDKNISFSYNAPVTLTEVDKIKKVYIKNTLTNDDFLFLELGEYYDSELGSYPQSFKSNTSKFTQEFNYLSTIQSDNETVELNYSSREDNATSKKLDNINILNKLNQEVKNINFSYDYFVSVDDSSDKRLKLNSITFNNESTYSFEYNSIPLPSKLSNSVDYWGFYNGHPNTNLFPKLSDLGYPQYNDNSQNNFSSNINYTKACTLERIIYPTKGYTTFEYESHTFDNLLYDSQINGNTVVINNGSGLRIKEIKNYNHDNVLTTRKSFNYINGKSLEKRNLIKNLYTRRFYASQDGGVANTVDNLFIIASLNNFINTNHAEGYNGIGYDTVEIMDLDTNGNNNGKTVKEFTNKLLNCIMPLNNTTMDAVAYSNINDIENGKLKSEKVYSSNNNLVTETTFEYSNKVFNQNFYGISIAGNGMGVTSYLDNGNMHYDYYPRTLLTFYPIKGKTSFMSTKEVKEYFPTGTIFKRTTYSYDMANNLTNEITFLMPNVVLSESKKTMSYVTNEIHRTKNLLTLPKTESYFEKSHLKEVKEYFYQEAGNITRLVQVNLLPEGSSDPNKATKLFYDLFDDKHNILQYHMENGINTCIVWGYNKTLPIAKIENCNYSTLNSSTIQDLQSESDTGSESVLINKLNLLRSSLPDAMVTTYTHIPLVGASTITDSKGDKTTYEYDSTGRLIKVYDKEGKILSENQYHYKPQN